MKNNVLTDREVLKQKTLLHKSIQEVITKIENQDCSVFLGNSDFHLLGYQDIFRILLLSLDNCERAYKNVVLNSAYRLNLSCSFVVPVYLSVLSQLLEKEYSLDRQNTFLSFLDKSVPKRCQSQQVIDAWKSTTYDKLTYDNFELIHSAIQEAGSLGSVIVSNQGTSNYIEIDNGCNFDVQLNQFFDDIIPGKVNLKQCIVVVVEGSIIEVSQLHHLLNYAYENKQSVVLAATAYSEDVSNTLAVNWRSGKLNVLPLIIDQELENINQVRDLCEVTGIIPVSSGNGTLVSNIEFDKLPRHTVTYIPQSKKLTVHSSISSIARVQLLRSSLQKKLEKEKVEDVISILKKRLSKMSVRNVTINIGCGDGEIGILRDRTASLFQLLSRCASQGTLDASSLYNVCSISNESKKRLPVILPFSDVNDAIRRAVADAKAIDSIRAIIKMED